MLTDCQIAAPVSVFQDMARKLRYVPPDSFVEITVRTLQGRFLLKPSPQLNDLVLGVLARAQERLAMRVCAFVYLSNHAHLLLRPTDARQLARFMNYIDSNIAREAGRLHGWREKFWGRRYTDVVVSDEPEAQIGRLRYLLSQGVKEGLVASPKHWPGASSVLAMMTGKPLTGTWIDRSQQYRAHLRGESTQPSHFASTHALQLSPIPCWDELSQAQHQTRSRHLVREIEQEGAERHAGRAVLGKQAILTQDPHDRPAHSKRSPAPRFHAVEPQVRRALEWAYRLFRLEYRQAAEDLRLGKTDVTFPPGSFSSPGQFVPLTAPG